MTSESCIVDQTSNINEYINVTHQYFYSVSLSYTFSPYFLSLPVVLLELKEFVHPSQVQPVEETEPCDPDQANLLERTPTPTSVEVRED